MATNQNAKVPAEWGHPLIWARPQAKILNKKETEKINKITNAIIGSFLGFQFLVFIVFCLLINFGGFEIF